jgi:hypothetical protein
MHLAELRRVHDVTGADQLFEIEVAGIGTNVGCVYVERTNLCRVGIRVGNDAVPIGKRTKLLSITHNSDLTLGG